MKGVATGVVLTILAGGGIRAVQFYRSGEILSDVSFTQKVKYLENMIDEEYLGDISTDDLKEGVYAGLIYGMMCIPGIIRKNNTIRKMQQQKDPTLESEYPCSKMRPVECRSWSVIREVLQKKRESKLVM